MLCCKLMVKCNDMPDLQILIYAIMICTFLWPVFYRVLIELNVTFKQHSKFYRKSKKLKAACQNFKGKQKGPCPNISTVINVQFSISASKQGEDQEEEYVLAIQQHHNKSNHKSRHSLQHHLVVSWQSSSTFLLHMLS